MAKRDKAPSEPSAVQSEADLILAIAQKGAIDRELEAKKGDAEAAVSAIKTVLGLGVKPLLERVKKLMRDMQRYCETHRAELTEGGKVKSAELTTGTVGWRNDTPSVTVKGEEPQVIDALNAAGLTQFVRTVYEIDRDAILRARSAYVAAKVGSYEHKEYGLTMAALNQIEAITINVGVEKFYVTPLTLATPKLATPAGVTGVTAEVAA